MKKWIFALITLVILSGVGITYAIRPEPVAPVQTYTPVTKVAPDTDELNTLVNDYRISLGLKPLIRDTKLDSSALDKCNDMVTKNYWNHTAPDGTLPWVFIDKYYPKYLKAGENLEYGINDAITAITNWKISPTHNKNLVDPNYTNVGYATCQSQNYVGMGFQNIIVQHLAQI